MPRFFVASHHSFSGAELAKRSKKFFTEFKKPKNLHIKAFKKKEEANNHTEFSFSIEETNFEGESFYTPRQFVLSGRFFPLTSASIKRREKFEKAAQQLLEKCFAHD